MIRVPVPVELATEVLFASDRTCCVCHERGRPVQIHHIDANPANNTLGNLAVLCLLCHEETQRRGSFARTLDSRTVGKYRDDWHDRVSARRKRADELATVPAIVREKGEYQPGEGEVDRESRSALLDYVWRLPVIRAGAYSTAQPRWDSGNTGEIVQATYDAIDVLVSMLQNLAEWFPASHFGNQYPDEYFSEFVTARFVWRRALAEPGGAGTGGTIVGIDASVAVLSDCEVAVDEMVSALLFDGDGFDLKAWRRAWTGAASAGEEPWPTNMDGG